MLLQKLFNYGCFIDQKGLKRICEHKYVPGQYTPLDLAMQPFWEWVTQLLPMWLAPNLITLGATLLLLGSVMLFALHDSTLSAEFPTWYYYQAAFSMFAYQTLDAVDGKQARRTGNSTPLGQLFDHGCDGFVMNLMCFLYYQSLQTGYSIHLFAILFASLLSFFSMQVEESETHVLRTSVGVFGVSELQNISASIMFFSGFTGLWFNRAFLVDIPFLGENLPLSMQTIEFRLIFSLIGFVWGGTGIVTAMINMVKVTKMRPRFLTLQKLIPGFLYVGLLLFTYSESDWAKQNAGYIYLMTVPSISMIIQKQIVCNVAGMQPKIIPKTTLWFFLFSVNHRASCILGSNQQIIPFKGGVDSAGRQMLFEDKHVCIVVFILVFFNWMLFVVGTVNQISTALGIR